MPYLDSNIPSEIFYTSVVLEILCVTKITTDLTNMVVHVYLWLIREKKQGTEYICTI